MRRIVCLAAALALVSAGAGRADEKDNPKAVIDKAVKAAGGEEKLAKYRAVTFNQKGKFYGLGEDGVAYTGEFAVQYPDKMRVRIEGDAGGGNKFVFIQVVNGDKLWSKINDEVTEETDKDKIAEAREANYAGDVASLLPLVKGKDFTLTGLGEVKVNGKPAVGVRVAHKGRRDVNLYFDRDSGLLVMVERVVKDMMNGGKEVTQEEIFSDYKEVSGVKQPLKNLIKRDGKKYIDAENSDFALKEKLDDATFAKP